MEYYRQGISLFFILAAIALGKIFNYARQTLIIGFQYQSSV